jgi:RimJ/RimL family protein N-acetyltransferase
MLRVQKNILLFSITIIFTHVIQSNYQAEHYVEFDETMRYQFVDNQNDSVSFDKKFYLGLPFQPLLQAMLQGVMPYEFLDVSNHDQNPYVLIKSTANYVYLVGKPNQDQLEAILLALSQHKGLALICDESLQSYFVQHGFSLQSRMEFEYAGNKELQQNDIPEGFQVQPLNLALFKQSTWYGFIASIYAGPQRFLDKGFGFALVDDAGNSVAQAYGTFIGNGLCEIGIVTHPDHRGKGYIVYPAIAVIQECFARGITPVWSCNVENIASFKTAHKLGFKIKRHYVFLKKY